MAAQGLALGILAPILALAHGAVSPIDIDNLGPRSLVEFRVELLYSGNSGNSGFGPYHCHLSPRVVKPGIIS